LNAGVEVMKQVGGSKWLSDDRENEVFFLLKILNVLILIDFQE